MKKHAFILAAIFMLLMSGTLFAADQEKFPFFPSLLSTSTGGPVSSSEFEDPERCRICHRDIYNQWKGSMHSNAWVDPVFQAVWKMGDKETGGAIRNHCSGCHSPIGTAGEEVSFDPASGMFRASTIAEKGVQCDFCHTVKDSTWRDTPTSQPQNGSLIMDPGDVKRGPYEDSNSPGHGTVYSRLHTSAEFCGSCHHVFHPVTNFPIERTYDEWKQSVYARAGIVCQDCHMMPLEKAVAAALTLVKPVNPGKASPMGPERDTVYTHEFVGGNFTLPKLLGSQKHSRLAEGRLKNAADIRIHIPERAVRGHLVKFKVEVINVGAGHNLPTSLTEVRQMWLDVTVRDPEGEVLMRSGALDDNGNIDPDADIFRTVAVDKDGNVTHKPWAISHFREVRVIPPKGSDKSTYIFLLPDKIKKGELSIDAVLRYRSFPQHLADELLGEGALQVPVVEMKRAAAVLPVTRK